MTLYYDQLDREINLPYVPKRIISVVPSQTELLFYLGMDEEIIGITKFCIHPADKFKSKVKVGGTKQLDINKIKLVQPDLIIANKEENERSQIEELTTICPVWISDINNLDTALDMIEKVGMLVGKENQAQVLSKEIKKRFEGLNLTQLNQRVAYFIWRKPYMVAGKNTFIDDMLQKCGFTNAFDLERYPEINNELLIKLKPDVILLSSEPYPFKEKHIAEFKSLVPSVVVKVVDGEMFSWYGNRLLHAPEYFSELIDDLKSV